MTSFSRFSRREKILVSTGEVKRNPWKKVTLKRFWHMNLLLKKQIL